MRLAQKELKFRKISVYRVFIFFLIVFSIFRARISIPFGPQYIKILEAYVVLCLPLIILMLVKNVRSLFTFSSLFLVFLFIVFYAMNYISGILLHQYISEDETLLFYFRLGLIFIICLVLLAIVTPKYPLLIDSIYKGFVVAGILILVWIIFFPQYKTSGKRFTGPIGDPNYAAAFVIISLNVSTYLALVARKGFVCLVLSALAIVFFATIVISLSRGALLGALTSLVVLVWAVVIGRGRFIHGIVMIKKRYFQKAVGGFLLLSLSVILIFVSWPNLFDKFIKRLSIERILSQQDQTRQTLWRLGLHSIAENPVGYGMGQMRAKHRLLDPDRKRFGHSTEVHNIVLQVGGAFGWPGLLIFVVFLFFLLGVCYKLVRSKHFAVDTLSAYPVPLATSFIGIFVQGLLFNFLFLKYYWIVAVLLLSYYEYENNIVKTGKITTKRKKKYATSSF